MPGVFDDVFGDDVFGDVFGAEGEDPDPDPGSDVAVEVYGGSLHTAADGTVMVSSGREYGRE
jgi:hypothetical protein